jgi:hypothetical protein
MELVLRGKQGKTLTIVGDTIRIEKRGLLTGQREKTIPIRNVASVEVKKPGGFAGFIQFSIAGGKARDSSYSMSGGAIEAAQDENSVVFTGQANYETAQKIKTYVETWLAGERTAAPTTASAADEIRKLKALMDEGVITAEDFEKKKNQLLGI